jgi:hypothetical protein
MTKIFVQIVVCTLASLGIISGLNADVREQARQTGGEVKVSLCEALASKFPYIHQCGDLDLVRVKAEVHEVVTSTVGAASKINATAGVQAGTKGSLDLSGQQKTKIKSGSGLLDLNLGNISTGLEAEVQADVEADVSAQGTGLGTWLGLDLSASNGLSLCQNNSD